jgi:hypothetical protein
LQQFAGAFERDAQTSRSDYDRLTVGPRFDLQHDLVGLEAGDGKERAVAPELGNPVRGALRADDENLDLIHRARVDAAVPHRIPAAGHIASVKGQPIGNARDGAAAVR